MSTSEIALREILEPTRVMTADNAADWELAGCAVSGWASVVKREGTLSREQLTAMADSIGTVPIYVRLRKAMMTRGVRDPESGALTYLPRGALPHWPASDW